jgi:5'-3' exonuclease
MDKLLFDATNLLHRTYHSSKKSRYENSHIFYFLKGIKDVVDKFESNDMYFCWDTSEEFERNNFRYSLIPEYKGHRDRTESEEIHQHDQKIYELISLLGGVNLFPRKMEGDDILAWLCLEKFKTEPKVLISVDKDFYQLIHKAENLRIYSPIKKLLLEKENFDDIVGLPAKDFLKFKILQGDSSDNVKGIYGVGEVRGKKFAQDWKNYLETLTSDQKKILATNIKIMDLTKGYSYYGGETEYYENQLIENEMDLDSFFIECRNLDLFSIGKNHQEWEYSFDIDKNPLSNMYDYFNK